jgi:predicted P-loop ATPase
VHKVLPFPPVPPPPLPETERKQRLFAWAEDVLKQLGLDQAIARAKTLEELHKVTFNENCVEVRLAIREALHPVSGHKADHFIGLREGGLKLVLRNRFADWKKDRKAALRNARGRRRRSTDWTDDLILDEDGGIIPNLANLILILRKAPKWEGVIAYDEFDVRVVIRKRPPWGEETADMPWTDHHETRTMVWFQHEGLTPSRGDVGRAVQAAARYNPFHPVRNYFDSLAWDQIPRLDMWLQTYFHVEDSDYVRAIGPRYLTSAVARIYDPGCQVDHMLVLEGPQGRRKSEALRTLAVNDKWFTDRLSHVSSKDVMLEIAGVLLIEIAELDALTRASTSAINSFLTRRHDRFRPPYGKHPINVLRQCVFAGTVNPPVGGYLKDPTGARRIWPVLCHGVIDTDDLKRDRDQLWAEAVVRFKAGAKWWLETPQLEALAEVEQRLRYRLDAWAEPIREWLGEDRNDVSVTEVLEQALGFAREDWTQSAQNRAVKILTAMGFSQHRPRKDDKRERRYQRDPLLRKSSGE